MSNVEPRSLLGLPVRPILAIGASALPLAAVGWFSGTHEWPPRPGCEFAVLGCPSAPYPISVQALDWLDLVGPVLGSAAAVGAIWLLREDAEPMSVIVLFRYVGPVVGLLVSLICTVQLIVWVTH